MDKPNFKKLIRLSIQTLTNFPYIEEDFDALTNYELLCKVVEELNKISYNQKLLDENITALIIAFNELKDYVDNYFENLDVQEEINNKLDELVADGTLESIIATYLQTQKIYNTHEEMLADVENLYSGLNVQTLGYYSLNDGGGAFYQITDTVSSDYQESLGSGLYATLINKNEESIKVFGAVGDGTTNDLDAFTKAMSSNIDTLIVDNGTYLFNGTFTVSKNIKGKNATVLMDRTNADEFGIIVTANNIEIKDLQFRAKSSNKLFKIASSNFIKLSNCKIYSDVERTSGGLLDLYTSNHDILIENCYFETHSTGSGGLWVREGTTDGNSSNISFNNCKFIGDTVDETIAIWGWHGTVENVTVNNSHIIRPVNVAIENSFPITLGQSGITKNSGFNNCTFDIYQAKSAIIRGSNINDSGLYLNNCIINTYMQTLTNGLTVLSNNDGKGFIVKNCIINEKNSEGNPALSISTNIVYDNCVINTETQILLNRSQLRNCVINNNPIFQIASAMGRSLIAYNCIFNNINSSYGRFLQPQSTSDVCMIDSCKFNYIQAPDRLVYATNINPSENLIVKDSIFKGIIYANIANVTKGYIIGNYTNAESIGTLSANLLTANNTTSFDYDPEPEE